MRGIVRVAVMLSVAAAVAAGQTEEASPFAITFETAAVSQYLWRGFVMNDSPSIQPGATVSYKGLSLSTWHNFSRRAPNGQSWTEHDVTLEYSKDAGRFTASAGYAVFHYPDMAEENLEREVFFTLTHNSAFSPSIEVHRGSGGFYYFASVNRSFPVSSRVSVEAALGAGLNQHQFQPVTTISDVDGTVSAAIQITKRLTVSPTFTQMIGHRSAFGRHHAAGVILKIE